MVNQICNQPMALRAVHIQGGAKRMDSPIFKSGDYNFNLIASI